MREAIALIIVMLMGAFAGTKANGYIAQQSQEELLAPVYSYIESNEDLDRNTKIMELTQALEDEEAQDPFVQSAIEQVVLYLIEKEEEENTQIYQAFIEKE